MQSLAARRSTMFGANRMSPSQNLVSAPRRVEVIVMAVPKKKMSKSRTNLRFTVWMKAAEAQAEIALAKARLVNKQKDQEKATTSDMAAPADKTDKK